MHPVARTVLVATALLAAPAHVARAEEGMWLPNALPAAALKAKHGFEASPALLERLQKSCVRFSTGGSGSIVSADGLVMT
ncbi:MAG: S46 family peptidase, partial [Phycisphaerales bacterium]